MVKGDCEGFNDCLLLLQAPGLRKRFYALILVEITAFYFPFSLMYLWVCIFGTKLLSYLFFSDSFRFFTSSPPSWKRAVSTAYYSELVDLGFCLLCTLFFDWKWIRHPMISKKAALPCWSVFAGLLPLLDKAKWVSNTATICDLDSSISYSRGSIIEENPSSP